MRAGPPADGVSRIPHDGVTTTQADLGGPQPTDPPWARLLFALVQGREGQWWRAILLFMPLFAVIGLIVAWLSIDVWTSGALAAAAWAWPRRTGHPRRRRPTSRSNSDRVGRDH
ncbi:MAG: hypothetical protein ACRDTH_09865 [Pseudonocardiaceae bacterium]